MKKRKKRRNGKYWQNCPVCGDTKRFLYKSTTLHWKPYSVSCAYCHFCTEPAFTKRGARKKWNKATNIHLVEEKRVGGDLH